jgi:hypothetical protein
VRAPDDLSVEQPTDDGPLAGFPAADEARKRSANSRMAALYILTLAIGLFSARPCSGAGRSTQLGTAEYTLRYFGARGIAEPIRLVRLTLSPSLGRVCH